MITNERFLKRAIVGGLKFVSGADKVLLVSQVLRYNGLEFLFFERKNNIAVIKI